jgi:hypothetical protein
LNRAKKIDSKHLAFYYLPPKTCTGSSALKIEQGALLNRVINPEYKTLTIRKFSGVPVTSQPGILIQTRGGYPFTSLRRKRI